MTSLIQTNSFLTRTVLALSLLLSIWFSHPLPSNAAESLDEHVNRDTSGDAQSSAQIVNHAEGVTIQWTLESTSVGGVSVASAEAALQSMSRVRFGGYALPMQLETVWLPDDVHPIPQFHQLDNQIWSASLEIAEPLAPLAIGWEEEFEQPKPKPLVLPSEPVFILREGRLRGQRVAVLAFSPIYVEAGSTRVVRKIEALVPDVQVIKEPLSLLTVRSSGLAPTFNPESLGPSNPAAVKNAVKIHVHHPGIQQIRGDAFVAAGMIPGIDLAKLHLWFNGVQIPLEVRDTDNRLDETTELRFYAQPADHTMSVRDRWNATAIYWLTAESGNGLRMSTHDASIGSAPIRETAIERGIWEENKLYESAMSGIDEDHWFSRSMVVSPGQQNNPATYPRFSIQLNHVLPLVNESSIPSVFTLTGSAKTIAPHTLQVNVGVLQESFSWQNLDNYENWQQTIETPLHPPEIELVLLPSRLLSEIRLDKIYWSQPVNLDFRYQGAAFSTVSGTWRYQLINPPREHRLYDITEPLNPRIIHATIGTDLLFESGPQPHDYILSGPGTLHHPQLTAHKPVLFDTQTGADALYIAPVQFFDALLPLVQHRQRQGYFVQMISIQDIYDTWSFGHVSPEAIRDFLRFAVHNWNPSPISTVLVGDSTVDPHNYMGKQDGIHNQNVIPAYLANVDPFIGETACESCFAQLDGDLDSDSLTTPSYLTDPSSVADIWLGRFSVQDESQVSAVVNKILRYETNPVDDSLDEWRYTSLYVADNYLSADGKEDGAGDFAYLSDLIILGDPKSGIPSVQSPNMVTNRVYYDPSPSNRSAPWRIADPVQARLRVIEQFKQGPGLVSFNGHSHHFQWASTDVTVNQAYLFGTNDIFELKNIDQLSIVLEMTCYTGQFTRVSTTGTTIDERFQRYEDGGAVAIWSSAGSAVAYGNNALMTGFHDQLWRSPPLGARMGELIEAGYHELFQKKGCCQEARLNYLLLGDPLTPALIWAPNRQYLPLIRK
ncbi:hypothetical protein KFU94_07015 [Chloroflexi bacterium TSY]|nr:hypothetical protein [Chloroflexi bacterium TSY]